MIGEGQGGDGGGALEFLDVEVLFAAGVTEDFEGFAGEVNEPDFGDADAGVKGDFDATVVVERGVSYFDDGLDVGGGWMAFAVIIGAEMVPARLGGASGEWSLVVTRDYWRFEVYDCRLNLKFVRSLLSMGHTTAVGSVLAGVRGAQLVMHEWSEDESRAWCVIHKNPHAARVLEEDGVRMARYTCY
jgi:hypothetical protein